MSNLNERVLMQEVVNDAIKLRGSDTHAKNSERLAKDQGLGGTSAGKRFANEAMKGFVEKYKEYVEMQLSLPANRSTLIKSLLEKVAGEDQHLIDPQQLGRIIVRSLFRSMIRPDDRSVTVTRVGFDIGETVENYIKVTKLDMHHAKDKSKLMDMLRRQGNLGDDSLITRELNALAERVEIDHDDWTERNHGAVGTALLNLFYKSKAYSKHVEEGLTFGDIFVEHDDFCFKSGKKMTKKVIDIHEAGSAWIQENYEFIASITLSFLPMVIEPQDWTIDHGGYYDQSIYDSYTLIKGYKIDKIKKLYETYPKGFNTLMKTINTLQKTPFRINKTVWEAVQHVHDNKINLDRKGIPTYLQGWSKEIGEEHAAEYLKDVKKRLVRVEGRLTDSSKSIMLDFARRVIKGSALMSDDIIWREWAAIKKTVKSHHRGEVSKNILVDNTLTDSAHYYKAECDKRNAEIKVEINKEIDDLIESGEVESDEREFWFEYYYDMREFKHLGDEFYFCYNADYRGRIYPLAGQFSPQGSDTSRGMLEFANGVTVDPVADQDAIRQIAIVIANNFGEDKISLDDREMWTNFNTDAILECADDFENNTFWMEADKPFLFLQGCLEWKKYIDAKEAGETFVSTLPIGFDGSCNGIQHYSALFLDEVGAEAVNLVDSELPSDVYQEVANQALEIVKQSNKKGDPLLLELNDKLDGKLFGRKVAKRSVMTLPYGVSKRSSNAYVVDEVNKLLRQVEVEGKELQNIRRRMGSLIWEAILLVVKKPVTGKVYFQKIAREMVESWEMGLLWQTPTGFPVKQELKKRDVKPAILKVKMTTLNDSGERVTDLIERKYPRYTSEIDADEQANAVAPNFVHSFDSAHLQFSVNAAADEGMENFLVIHDSFATDCLSAGRFKQVISEQFVKMYDGKDYINKFHNDCNLQLLGVDTLKTKMEPRGNFDIKQVLTSKYFFS